MKLKDLDYDGVSVRTIDITDNDYKKISKYFKYIIPNRSNRGFLNLYIYNGLYRCMYRDSLWEETSIQDLRKMLGNIQSKLK